MHRDARARSQEKKNIEKLKLLFALIKGSRRSDRQLADDLGLSQATITRRRRELENEGFIKEYTVLPDLKKMGFEVVAFTFIQLKEFYTPEQLAWGKRMIEKRPEIVYYGEGEGLGELFVIISVHKNYQGYADMIRETTERAERARTSELRGVQFVPDILWSFRINTGSIPGIVSKPFSLRYLESALDPNKASA